MIKNELLEHFGGSIFEIVNAKVEDLSKVHSVSPSLAKKIHDELKNRSKKCGSFLNKGQRPKPEDDFETSMNNSEITLDWFNKEYCQWIRGFYIFRFMEEYKTEIRARRGVRLSLLQKIANGNFTERMLRYQCLHLANCNDHSELRNRSSGCSSLDIEYGREHEMDNGRDKFDVKKHWLLGQIFDGGGLLPHEDEVPGLRQLRAKRQAELEEPSQGENGE